METISYLTSRMHREILRHACGTAIYCPHCGTILDAESAVLVSQEGGGKHATAIMCGACWGNAPWTGKSGAVEVIDGRTLWAPRKRTHQWVAA